MTVSPGWELSGPRRCLWSSNCPAPSGSATGIPLPPIGAPDGRGCEANAFWRFNFNMAEVSRDNEAVEKGPEGSSPGSVPVDTTISRVKLLDTIVDTFLQKLVAATR